MVPCNVNLAAERFYILQPDGKSWFFLAIPFKKPSVDQAHPSTKTTLTVWFVNSTIGFIGSLVLTSYFYLPMFCFTSYQLARNPHLTPIFLSDKDIEQAEIGVNSLNSALLHTIRLQIERRVFTQCLILSMSLVVYYTPFWIYSFAAVANGGLVPSDPDGTGFWTVSNFLALDVVSTSILVLYFKADVRDKALFWVK
ncbi:hypothetical protein HK100_012174 [Physocladia obscura]|uniref:Uncharacterized protein n=1 Tax=Physocladia obscura TaxID=109957 RepID=A0AAD5T131_9FUNG|nr:hypothetical protein HK100_012174 [Physocladia obscura]